MTVRKLKVLPEILAYPNWRHRVHLGNGLYTMGYNTIDNDWEFYGMPNDLKGKSLLDLGANDGYYSFKAEEMGATEVTAMDIYGGDGSTMVGGWPLKGITMLKSFLQSSVEIKAQSVYELNHTERKWDVVLCNDLLSWLDDIPRALDGISRACNEKLIIHDTFNTHKSGKDVEVRQIGIARLHRMQINYLIRELKARGFRRFSFKRIYSHDHYAWQYENFPPASSKHMIKVWSSPLNGIITSHVKIKNVWCLQHFGEFVYLRDLGWAKKADLQIVRRNRTFWVQMLKKCMPNWFYVIRYSITAKERKTGEFVVTAER